MPHHSSPREGGYNALPSMTSSSSSSGVRLLERCPYNPKHKVKSGKMEVHVDYCRQEYVISGKKLIYSPCKYNCKHQIPMQELRYHESHCEDREYALALSDLEASSNKGESEMLEGTAIGSAKSAKEMAQAQDPLSPEKKNLEVVTNETEAAIGGGSDKPSTSQAAPITPFKEPDTRDWEIIKELEIKMQELAFHESHFQDREIVPSDLLNGDLEASPDDEGKSEESESEISAISTHEPLSPKKRKVVMEVTKGAVGGGGWKPKIELVTASKEPRKILTPVRFFKLARKPFSAGEKTVVMEETKKAVGGDDPSKSKVQNPSPNQPVRNTGIIIPARYFQLDPIIFQRVLRFYSGKPLVEEKATECNHDHSKSEMKHVIITKAGERREISVRVATAVISAVKRSVDVMTMSPEMEYRCSVVRLTDFFKKL